VRGVQEATARSAAAIGTSVGIAKRIVAIFGLLFAGAGRAAPPGLDQVNVPTTRYRPTGTARWGGMEVARRPPGFRGAGARPAPQCDDRASAGAGGNAKLLRIRAASAADGTRTGA
jgi:hypothetical protein